jgi:FRG domain
MFGVLRAKSWKDAIEIAEGLPGWIFRGHSNADWPLETTLFRGASMFGYSCDQLAHAENWMLREFRRRAHHYVSDPPPADDKLEWLALIQHYGGPTRLLDFSYSFYVAAFFAMERADKDAAIWAIDRFQLARVIAAKTGANIEVENVAEMNRRHIASFLDANWNKPIVANMEPERMNERLSIQQGLFLFPSDIRMPFVSVLEQTFGLPTGALANRDPEQWLSQMADRVSVDFSLVKLILPRDMHAAALQDLHRMNMNSATLFPGLDGFARSLYFHLRNFEIAGEF